MRHETRAIRVGDWQVEPLRGALLAADGEMRHLKPKVMEVLLCLADRAGQTVTRDELIDCVWGERGASDEVLTRAVSDLRQGLDDTTGRPRYVETIPKRGYRLVAPVADGAEPIATGGPPGHWLYVGVAAGVLAVMLLLVPALDRSAPDSELEPEALTIVDRRALDSLFLGRYFAARGDIARARAEFDNALLLKPDLVAAKLELALLEIERLGLEEGESMRAARVLALDALDDAHDQLASDPGSFMANLLLGQLLSTLGDLEANLAWRSDSASFDPAARFEAAELYLRRAGELDTQSSYPYQLLADVLEKQDRHADSVAVLEMAQLRDPFDVMINTELAKRLSGRGRYDDAIALLQRFEQLPETPIEIWWWQLELMQIHTHWDEKAALLIRLLEQHPDVFSIPEIRFQLAWFVADLAYLELYEEAALWREELAGMDLPEWAQLYADRFYFWATDNQGELTARTRRRLAGMTDAEIFDAWYNLSMNWAWDLAVDGETDRAIELLQRIRQSPTLRDERDTLPSLLLATLYKENGRHEEAETIARQVVRKLEAEVASGLLHPESLQRLVEAYVLLGRNDEAIQTLSLAIDYHWRMPWWKLPYRYNFYGLEDDPRAARMRVEVERDLRGQADRIRLLLRDHDASTLLAPASAWRMSSAVE